jgi:Resolvase, N terminal domain
MCSSPSVLLEGPGAAMSNSRKAIAYIRTSTKKQVLSLSVQRNAIESWASLAGVDVVEWHTDHGVSGALPMGKRPGMSAAMNTIIDNENICILVAAHRDRLTRDPNSAQEIYQQLSLCNVEFVAVDETIANSSASKFRQHVETSINKYKSDMNNAPTAREHLHALGVPLGGVAGGVEANPVEGHHIMASVRSEARAVADLLATRAERARDSESQTTSAPYGYRFTDDGVHLIADEGEQSVIARVRAARAAGLTVREIAEALRNAGIAVRAA